MHPVTAVLAPVRRLRPVTAVLVPVRGLHTAATVLAAIRRLHTVATVLVAIRRLHTVAAVLVPVGRLHTVAAILSTVSGLPVSLVSGKEAVRIRHNRRRLCLLRYNSRLHHFRRCINIITALRYIGICIDVVYPALSLLQPFQLVRFVHFFLLFIFPYRRKSLRCNTAICIPASGTAPPKPYSP